MTFLSEVGVLCLSALLFVSIGLLLHWLSDGGIRNAIASRRGAKHHD